MFNLRPSFGDDMLILPCMINKRCVLLLKGSESKLILSKLKSQLEELRSKVAFLDCVKKYLEVLTVLSTLIPYAFPARLTFYVISYVSADSERGPVGFGGLIAAFFGCLRT